MGAILRHVKYGTDVNISIKGIKMPIYIDIATFDCYEMIIRTLFMRRNQVVLDFKNNKVIINGNGYQQSQYPPKKQKCLHVNSELLIKRLNDLQKQGQTL